MAENLINPFGDGDDDFDIRYIIDRNFQISYLMVNGEPDMELEDDTYGGGLPHTIPTEVTDGVIPIDSTSTDDNEDTDTGNIDDIKVEEEVSMSVSVRKIEKFY